MTFPLRVALLLGSGLAICVFLYAFPALDLLIAARFYDGAGFPWRAEILPNFLHDLVHPLSLFLAALFAILTLWHIRQRTGWRRWLFLLLALIVGPGLLTNTLFKDNWGRARPLQIEQFGGTAQFSPPFVRTNQCRRNCSFVSGDAAFGFWFHSLAYVAPRRRRTLFWGGLGVGAGYGLLRIGMGAHFFSDVVAAGFLILATSAVLFGVMFGRRALAVCWREWLPVRQPA